MTEKRQRLYPTDDIVALVRSLDRPQDKGVFSQDVLLVYPNLAEKYTKICPRRCDIATAVQKAADDAYSYDAKLTPLREDVQLMVNNCHRFNGTTGPLADIANSFEKFAIEQIDAYVVKKTGGRRASFFRLSAAAEAAAPSKLRGKRQRDDEGQKQQTNRGAIHTKNGSSTAIVTKTTTNNNITVGTAELVKLVDSLNRREDKGAFVVDVATAYPELKASYEAMCPVKMNLTIVRERAESGYYLGQQKEEMTVDGATPPSIFGSSIAESLVPLRNDVELMVNNCTRFNANSQPWVQLALSFQAFAHKKIDDFVIRHVPALKGTRSGVSVYTEKSQQTQLKDQMVTYSNSTQEEEPVDPNATPVLSASSVAPAASSSASDVPLSSKRKAASSSAAAAAGRGGANLPPRAPLVSTVCHVTPTTKPTALQPMFKTPDVLRCRIVTDHLHRGTLRWRRIRSADDNNEDSSDDSARACTFQSALSCRAVLQAFAASVCEFFLAQRERQDFTNPFEYPRQEEQFYMDCIALIEQQFECLFLHILLYERERADVYNWLAARAVRQVIASGNTSDTASICFWLDSVHLCYLVRFLLHLPQLLGLACATVAPHSSSAAGVSNSRAALVLTIVAKGFVEKFAKITEELLEFIARYEQKIERSPDIAEVQREA